MLYMSDIKHTTVTTLHIKQLSSPYIFYSNHNTVLWMCHVTK